MPATEVDTSFAAEELAACVREAGTVALSMFQKPIRSWTKGPAESPVCEADVAVDEFLRQRLTAIDATVAWLSEESADDPARLDARYVWVIDPIDGTRAYIEGLQDWTISAALTDRGRPIAACLYAPATGEFFQARTASGATLNGAAIAATSGPELEAARIAGPKRFIDRFAAVAPPIIAVPRVRSLALRLARVAQGAVDLAIAGGNSHDWDLAAADLLVHEAGGLMTSLGGGILTYNRAVPRHGMLVAAGRERHAAFMALLGDGRLAFS